MNYCRDSYFGRTDLSPLDKLAARVYYGQMPSYDERTGKLTIPRIQKFDGGVVQGELMLVSALNFQVINSLTPTTIPSKSPATLAANGVLTIPELRYINSSGHVDKILKVTLQATPTATSNVYTYSFVLIQPTKELPTLP